MQLFYAKDFEQTLQLDEIDSKHCIRVLRKKLGDEIWVTDGVGKLFQCQISEANPKRTGLRILETEVHQEPRRRVHLAIAPTKNIDRMTYLVEKATEIGVSEISFFISENSERKSIKLDRLERVAVSAMKQSLKTYLPIFQVFDSLEACVQTLSVEQKFIAHLHEKALPLAQQNLESSVLVLVGPEGDFTENEVNMALGEGFQMVSLGESRLRTETAALVSITLMNLL
ncbi:16S rRNA (uracil(1498)-N(3))-methyltransferase [Marinilongibacter aquaticus]|uniref:16S rRNA (uracil(1498)-N(3))-methyltransferase n=1 Tax=Marinilongibacter aquaticus TaxID=2975157 RepID=UPI0021BDB5DC|nr:16S rRNA (uracil(1498)-N(3))-methyltransferase [Marinilongibacter aquaticus]UBM59286.1 16S rRNA (uracil(1498)-N(3))-methyltransferase [Marinilongibacter aquaticus]